MKSAPIILKLGGSLVVPKEIDVVYLKNFRELIKKHIRQGKRFIVIVGGGYTNRWYRDRAKEIGVTSDIDLHWIGTISTRQNAELVRSVFGRTAHPRPYWNFKEKVVWRKPILVVDGYMPGHSTDYDAVLMAQKFGAKKIINISNVGSLCNKDPRRFRGAKPIREISWKAFRRLFGNPRKHLPGQNIPIDAVAALYSKKHRIETFYVGGRNLKNLDSLLSGQRWRGTRIY